MKKLALMMVAAMITSLTFEKKMQEKDVPAPVKTAFQKQYPTATDVKWDKEGESPEGAHVKADRALLAFIGDKEVTSAFDGIYKWYA